MEVCVAFATRVVEEAYETVVRAQGAASPGVVRGFQDALRRIGTAWDMGDVWDAFVRLCPPTAFQTQDVTGGILYSCALAAARETHPRALAYHLRRTKPEGDPLRALFDDPPRSAERAAEDAVRRVVRSNEVAAMPARPAAAAAAAPVTPYATAREMYAALDQRIELDREITAARRQSEDAYESVWSSVRESSNDSVDNPATHPAGEEARDHFF